MNLAPLWRHKIYALLQNLRCFFLDTFALPQRLSFPSKYCHSLWAGSTSVKKDVVCRCPSIPIKGWTKPPNLSEEISLNLVPCSTAKKLVSKQKETFRTLLGEKDTKLTWEIRNKIAWNYHLRPNDNKFHLQKLTNNYNLPVPFCVYLSSCISKAIKVNELCFVVESRKLNWHH